MSRPQSLGDLLGASNLPRDVTTLIGRTFQFSFIDDTDNELKGFFFGRIKSVSCLLGSERIAIQLYFDLAPSVVGICVSDIFYDRKQGSWCVRMRVGDNMAREVPGKLVVF